MSRADDFSSLEGHKYCALFTFRRSGEAVKTPVWFALQDGRLYFTTDDPSGKIKRIRSSPHVRVAPCGVTGKLKGPIFEGVARILKDAREKSRAEKLQRERYGLFRKIWMRTAVRYFHSKGLETVWVEVVPREQQDILTEPARHNLGETHAA